VTLFRFLTTSRGGGHGDQRIKPSLPEVSVLIPLIVQQIVQLFRLDQVTVMSSACRFPPLWRMRHITAIIIPDILLRLRSV
jgi:hypothetical protein